MNNNPRIPEFQSSQEEAKFWDTHSLADYWDELEPSDFRMPPNLRHVIRVPLNPDSIQRLHELSVAAGIKFDDLAATWIEERIQAESQPHKLEQ